MRARSKSEYKTAIRERARRKVRPHHSFKGQDKHRDAVEAGRTHLLRECGEGGDSQAKKIKNELTYLLSNYAPRFDARIEHLISEWRKSGDPAYDPGIRLTLRQARRQHMSDSTMA